MMLIRRLNGNMAIIEARQVSSTSVIVRYRVPLMSGWIKEGFTVDILFAAGWRVI